MKKIIGLLIAFFVLLTNPSEVFSRGGHSSHSSSHSSRSSSHSSSSKSSSSSSRSFSSGGSKHASSHGFSDSHLNGSKVGSGSKGVRTFASNKSGKSIKGTSAKPKAPSKYYGKAFKTPKTFASSSKYKRPYKITYTRPVHFVNPYLFAAMYHHHGYGSDTSHAVVDTNAFPGFGKGKSGGAGASQTAYSTGSRTHNPKDSLDIMDIQPINYLSDYSNVIPDKDEPYINSKIRQYKKMTGVEIAVVILPTLGEEVDIDDYAQMLFDKWGIGEKDINNGVLILITTEDEMIRIQPGYGLEEILTDADSRRIEDLYMVPSLTADQWENGVVAGISGIKNLFGTGTLETTKQAYAQKKAKEDAEFKSNMWTSGWVALGILFLVIIITFIRRKINN